MSDGIAGLLTLYDTVGNAVAVRVQDGVYRLETADTARALLVLERIEQNTKKATELLLQIIEELE